MKIIHPDQLDPGIERRPNKSARLHARPAGPQSYFGVAGDLLVAVRRTYWHKRLADALNRRQHGVMEQHERDAVT